VSIELRTAYLEFVQLCFTGMLRFLALIFAIFVVAGFLPRLHCFGVRGL
jgi:hypothetical protein